MNKHFKIGDVVFLNSDQKQKVAMTIDSFDENKVVCKWFTSLKNVTSALFDKRMLYIPEKTD